MSNKARNFFIALVVFMVAVSVAAGAVPDDLNTSGVDDPNTAPNPYLRDNGFTKAQHPMTEGTSAAAVSGIYDDNGDWVSGANSIYEVNESSEVSSGDNVNPYTFKPGHIDDPSYVAFEDDDGTPWWHAANWTAGGTNSSGLTITNASVDQGVDAVRIDSGTSFASGDTAHANRSNFGTQLDTDEAKRVLQFAMDVDSLESSTNVTVRVYDESDDYKEVTLNQSKTALSGNNFASSSGDSKVFQIKLDELTTTGGGSWDNIEKVSVIIEDGDADLSMTWLDLRKKSKNTLGEKMATTDDDGADPDSDSDFDETQTIYNATGEISVHSMGTLGTEYDDAVINDLSYPIHIPASNLQTEGEEDDYVVYWENADDYPGFDHVLNVTYRLEAIGYIDASYSSLDLMMMQKWPEDRYISVEVEEGAAGSNLSDIDGTSKLSSLGAAGNDLDDAFKLDDSGSSDTEYLVHYEMKFTDDERSNDIEAAADGGGAGPALGGEGGFWDAVWDFITNPLGAIISLASVFVGVRWFRAR